MNSQPTQQKVDEKGNLFFNDRGLAWFGLDGLEDETGSLYSLTFSPFIGWGDDELPDHLKKAKERKILTEEEMLERDDDKTERITGKRPKRGSQPRKKVKSVWFIPRTNRKPTLLKPTFASKFIIQFTLFGNKVSKFGSFKIRKEAQDFLDECIERRDILYRLLKVKVGERNHDFGEYVRTGDETILERLKQKYCDKDN